MNDKQKYLLNDSLRVFNNIRTSMNDTNRKGVTPFEIRGSIRYRLSPNSNNVSMSRFNEQLYNEMEELLTLDDAEWEEALGENEDVAIAKGKLITLINVIRQQRGIGDPIPGGEDFYKEPEEQEQEQPEQEQPEQEQPEQEQPEQEQPEQDPPKQDPPKQEEPKEKVVYRFGVKKDLINARIATYQKIIDEKGPMTRPNSPKITPRKRDVEEDLLKLYKELADKNARLEELNNDKTSKTRSQDIAELKKSIEETQKRIDKIYKKYSNVLDYGFIVKELKSLVEQSKFETFVEMETIERQMKFYEQLLSGATIDKEELTQSREKAVSEKGELEKRKAELESLIEKAKTENSKELTLSDKAGMLKTLKDFRSGLAKHLKTNKANHYKDRVSSIDKEIAELEKEPGIQDELAKIEKLDDREISAAEKTATLRLLEKVRKDHKNTKGRANGKIGLSYQDLNTEIKRIRDLKTKKPVNIEKLEQELTEVQKNITDKDKEIQGIDEKLKIKEVPEYEQELQKRSAQARLKELQELSKDRELFKITEKGEVVISYPERKLSDAEKKKIADEIIQKLSEEARSANDLMAKEFYGHRETKDEFDEIMDRLKDPENLVMKKGTRIDENGNTVEYEYEGIKEYEGRDEDLARIKMSDYVMIYERVARAEAGDTSFYENMPDGKGEEQYKKDLEYLDYNNGKYDRVATTTKNLRTLGKYGEKVPYTQLQEGQPVRNALRGIGNALKFVRNHTTAPIYHFIGDKIVSPIYARAHKGQEGKSRGSFENKPLHRYLARRDYFESEGKGFFSSRFNAIFNATKGNKALLDIGASEIKKFYNDAAKRMYEQRIKQAETALKLQAIDFRKKDIAEQITMLEEAVKTAQTPEDKAKYEQTLKEYQMAAAQISKDQEQEMQTSQKAKQHVSLDVNYDAIDMDQHDRANKDTITKTVAVIKGLAKMGIRKFIGPKVKEWLLEKSRQEIETPVTTYENQVTDRRWVETTYRDETVPIIEERVTNDATMSEIMAENAGKRIEGYYSVYGGETRPQMYSLTGNEKITAVFQSTGKGGIGFSDTAGLKAPILVDKTFDSSLLGENGVLDQNITVDKFIEMLGDGKADPETLEGMYVSVGDRYWAKLSDLYQGTVEQVQVGEEIQKVVDQAGHWEDVITQVPVTTMQKTVIENPKILKILKGLGIAGKTAYAASVVEDVYENTRRTDTEVEPLKPDYGELQIQDIYTGRRRDDLGENNSHKKEDDEEER